MKAQLTTVKFDFIRYANCWEDADVLLEGLEPESGKKIISVASAGDNSFSLLTSDPELVVAVDINPTQLYLVELKRAAIKYLNYEEFLGFLGFREMTHRKQVFANLKFAISSEAYSYWEQHFPQIEAGLIHQGKFEKYFKLFRTKILPCIHNVRTIQQLFAPKSAHEQTDFYHSTWNNWRWRTLFNIFFSKAVMGPLGRDPEFLKQVEVDVAKFIFNKAEIQLKSQEVQNNYFLKYILQGDFGTSLPHFARRENFATIKENIDRLQIYEGLAEQAFQQYGTFHYANLSNIFEYMDTQTFRAVATQFAERITAGGKLAYWNLMVERRFSEILGEDFHYRQAISEQLSTQDNGFFYKCFIIDQKS